MKVNAFNERSRVNRDNVMLILLISSAELAEHQWVMERGCEAPAKEGERLRNTKREKVEGGLSHTTGN